MGAPPGSMIELSILSVDAEFFYFECVICSCMVCKQVDWRCFYLQYA